jgi:hypothetical protein
MKGAGRLYSANISKLSKFMLEERLKSIQIYVPISLENTARALILNNTSECPVKVHLSKM